MGERPELTEKEKLCIYGLVKYPTLNDRSLADKLGMRVSTVTAIRRRLREKEYFTTKRIPRLKYLGAELMIFAYGAMNSKRARDKIEKIEREGFKRTNAVMAITSGDFGHFVSVAKNYTRAKETIDDFQRYFTEHELFEDPNDWTYALFPFEISHIFNYLDFSSMVANAFGIKEEPKVYDSFEPENIDHVRLTKKEKLVFVGLVEHPELPDNGLADKLGVSRQGVSSMRKRFEKKDLITTVRIPNLRMMGIDILGLAHSFLSPRTSVEDRSAGIKMILNRVPLIFMMSSNFENFLTAAYTNYDDFVQSKNEVLRLYKEQKFITREPTVRLFSMKDATVIASADYVAVTKEIVEELE